ncbi:MAG TPA: hypothetical protein VFR70_05600 [Flavobacterium sp.]|nr:hypothetical protein [Flavobacterium sp.]
MLTKGLRDEENERINNVLKQLISLAYIPEGWNGEDLDNQLKYLALEMNDIFEFFPEELIRHLEKLHFDWANAELFGDFLVQVSERFEEEKSQLKLKAVAVYEYVQRESKTFSFGIFNKIASSKK